MLMTNKLYALTRICKKPINLKQNYKQTATCMPYLCNISYKLPWSRFDVMPRTKYAF